MSKMSKSRLFKTLRMKNQIDPEGNLMPAEKIKDICNNAFGCHAVQSVRRNTNGTKAGTSTITLKQDLDTELWKPFYDDLTMHSCVYIDPATDFTKGCIKYGTEPTKGHWQVRLAEKTNVTDFGSPTVAYPVSVSEPTKVADLGPAELDENEVDSGESESEDELPLS